MYAKPPCVRGHRFVLGLFIFVMGILFLLDNLHLMEIGNVFGYWPIIFVLFGIMQFCHRTLGGIVWGIILILVGVGLMSRQLFGVEINLMDFWPLLLILIGLSMIFRSLRLSRHRHHLVEEEESTESYIKATAILGGVRKIVLSKDFLGGDVTAILGGLQFDLRESEIQTEAVLDVFVVMGGMEILIPQNWRVVVDALPILGGASDSTRPVQGEQSKVLKIRGTIVLGGVEIKNYSDEDWAQPSK